MLDANCEQKPWEDCGSLQQAHFQSKSKGRIQEFTSEASTGHRTCHTAINHPELPAIHTTHSCYSFPSNFPGRMLPISDPPKQKGPKIFAAKLRLTVATRRDTDFWDSAFPRLVSAWCFLCGFCLQLYKGPLLNRCWMDGEVGDVVMWNASWVEIGNHLESSIKKNSQARIAVDQWTFLSSWGREG